VSVFACVHCEGERRFLLMDVTNTGRGLPPCGGEALFTPFRHVLEAETSSVTAPARLSGRRGRVGATRLMSVRGMQVLPTRVPAAVSVDDSVQECAGLMDALVNFANAAQYHRVPVTMEGMVPPATSTGLGLPLSRGFAKACGGYLALHDDDLGNTHFLCVVPAPLPPSVDTDASPVTHVPSVAETLHVEELLTPSRSTISMVGVGGGSDVTAVASAVTIAVDTGAGSASSHPAAPTPLALDFPSLVVVVVEGVCTLGLSSSLPCCGRRFCC
jgi:hypothetical protein